MIRSKASTIQLLPSATLPAEHKLPYSRSYFIRILFSLLYQDLPLTICRVLLNDYSPRLRPLCNQYRIACSLNLNPALLLNDISGTMLLHLRRYPIGFRIRYTGHTRAASTAHTGTGQKRKASHSVTVTAIPRL